MEKAFIHTFKTPKNYYLYDFNTNAILRISRSLYYLLRENNNLLKDEVIKCTSELREKGFLSSHQWECIQHPATKYMQYYLGSSIKLLTLQVTQQCNLRCHYCPYSGSYYNREHNDKKMNFETAKKVIDFYICHAYDMPVLQIGFYGGEPLLEYSLITKLMQYIESRAYGKKVEYRITTNGTLLTNEIIEFFIKKEVKLTISLDGPREYHNRNRLTVSDKGSFDIIIKNLKMIHTRYPEYAKTININCVIDPRNDLKYLHDFFKTHEIIKEHFTMFSTISREGIKDEKLYLEDEKFQRQYNHELFKMLYCKTMKEQGIEVSDIILAYYSQLKMSIFDRETSNIIENVSHPGGPCITGTHRLFADIHGRFYPCERISELSNDTCIGNVEEGFFWEKIDKLLNVGKLTESKCKKCWAAKLCDICVQQADSGVGITVDEKLKHCKNVCFKVEETLKDYCLILEGRGFKDEVMLLNNINYKEWESN